MESEKAFVLLHEIAHALVIGDRRGIVGRIRDLLQFLRQFDPEKVREIIAHLMAVIEFISKLIDDFSPSADSMQALPVIAAAEAEAMVYDAAAAEDGTASEDGAASSLAIDLVSIIAFIKLLIEIVERLRGGQHEQKTG